MIEHIFSYSHHLDGHLVTIRCSVVEGREPAGIRGEGGGAREVTQQVGYTAAINITVATVHITMTTRRNT